MKNKEELKELFSSLQNKVGAGFEYDENAIESTFEKNDGGQPLSVKILSIVGGVFASIFFLCFILLLGFSNSEVLILILGLLFIAGAVWVNKEFDNLLIDTSSISFYCIGFGMCGFSLGMLHVDERLICVLFIVLALATLRVLQNYIISLFAVLIINGSIIGIILYEQVLELLLLYVGILAIGMTYVLLNEGKLITSHRIISRLYNPLKIGLILSFLSGLICVGVKDILSSSINYVWVASIIILAVLVYAITVLFKVLGINDHKMKCSVSIITVVVLLPTVLSPAIAGAILILLLCFLVNYKTGFVLGICSLIYFISQYYYDLSFSLLTKSILLFSTGVLFIILYLLTYKKLISNEKV